MDYLRSCYSCEAVFTVDGSTLVDTIDWHFTDSGVRFPGRHVFGSLNWSNNRFGFPDSVLGEVPTSPRPWRDGSFTGPASGGSVCGDLSWYVAGVPNSAVRPITLDANGDPACCSGLPPVIHPVMPPGPPNTTRLVDFRGTVIPGVWDFFNRWIYNPPSLPETWFWRFPADGRARNRDCTWQQFQVNKSPSGAFSFLSCVAVDPVTGARTWVDPTGVIIPPGQHVTEFPRP